MEWIDYVSHEIDKTGVLLKDNENQSHNLISNNGAEWILNENIPYSNTFKTYLENYTEGSYSVSRIEMTLTTQHKKGVNKYIKEQKNFIIENFINKKIKDMSGDHLNEFKALFENIINKGTDNEKLSGFGGWLGFIKIIEACQSVVLLISNNGYSKENKEQTIKAVFFHNHLTKIGDVLE